MRIKHAEEVRYLNDLILDARQKVRRNDKLDILELCSFCTYNQMNDFEKGSIKFELTLLLDFSERGPIKFEVTLEFNKLF